MTRSRVVRALYDATNRLDLHAVLALTAEDVDIRASVPWTGVNPKQSGHDGVRRLWSQWKEHDIQPLLIVHGLEQIGGRVLSHYTVTTVRGSLPPGFASTLWGVLTVDPRGLIVANWNYRQEIEARAAIHTGLAF
jgi:ketosteroid isomerase-like protein